jgi:hypothetical protein
MLCQFTYLINRKKFSMREEYTPWQCRNQYTPTSIAFFLRERNAENPLVSSVTQLPVLPQVKKMRKYGNHLVNQTSPIRL